MVRHYVAVSAVVVLLLACGTTPATTQTRPTVRPTERSAAATPTTANDNPVELLPTAQSGTIIETTAAIELVGTAKSDANVRDRPTAEGSTILGQVTPGEVVQLRMRNTDSTWYGLTTSTGLVGWVSASLLTIDKAVAAQVFEGTAEDLGVVVPVVEPVPAVAPPRVDNSALNTGGRDVYDCGDFDSWSEANDVYQANLPGDPNKLDQNDDGSPCDSLR